MGVRMLGEGGLDEFGIGPGYIARFWFRIRGLWDGCQQVKMLAAGLGRLGSTPRDPHGQGSAYSHQHGPPHMHHTHSSKMSR